METLRAITLTACFLGIATVIVDTVQPGETFSKQIRMVFSLIFAVAVANMVINFKSVRTERQTFNTVTENNSKRLETSVNDILENSVKTSLENELSARLADKGIECEEISAEINISDDGSICINKVFLKCGDRFEEGRRILENNIGEKVPVVKITEP